MKVIGYIRVSTEQQAVEGVSLEAQESKIRAWAALNDYAEVEIHIDAGISGKRADNRPALQSALNACGPGDALVVYSLSRLARSTADTIVIAERLKKAGADLVSLSEKIDTTTAAGKMVFRMLAVLAEFERDQTVERVTVAMAHKKAKGERVGSVPYGFRLASDGVKLLPEPSEQAVVATVRRLRAEGTTFRAIASQLETAGHQPRGNRRWHPQTVSNIAAA